MKSIPHEPPYIMSVADRVTYIVVFGIIISLILAFFFFYNSSGVNLMNHHRAFGRGRRDLRCNG